MNEDIEFEMIHYVHDRSPLFAEDTSSDSDSTANSSDKSSLQELIDGMKQSQREKDFDHQDKLSHEASQDPLEAPQTLVSVTDEPATAPYESLKKCILLLVISLLFMAALVLS